MEENIYKKAALKILTLNSLDQSQIVTKILNLDKKINILPLSALVLGISTISTQIILVREFLNVFYGNELVIGIILAIWMLFTSVGARLGKNLKTGGGASSILQILFLASAILPSIELASLHLSWSVLFLPGSMPGPGDILSLSAIILLPFCLVSGLLFSVLCRFQEAIPGNNHPAGIYYMESFGSFTGGLVITGILVFFLKSVHMIFILAALNFGMAGYFSFKHRSRWVLAISLLLFILSGWILLLLPFDKILKDRHFKDQQVLIRQESPYGNLVVTESGGQFNFYENGLPLFPANDPIEAEEAVHYAMLQHPMPRKVLLISGGISGQMKEILKYPVTKVIYVEMNPAVVNIGKRLGVLPDDKRVQSLSKDPVLFIRQDTGTYDVALIQLPGPSNLQINRCFTLEFFQNLKKHLQKTAVVAISLRSTADYVDKIGGQINSLLYNTLKAVFCNVIIVPGNKNYFIASDSQLSLEIAGLASARKIETLYVNEFYLDDQMISQRNAYIMHHIDTSAGMNHDLRPTACYCQMQLWISQFRTHFFWPFVVIGILLIIYLFRLKPVSFGMFFTGFTASSLELILLTTFQILYGYVYLASGILISFFMAGLAAGSFFAPRIIRNQGQVHFARLQLVLAFAVLFALGLILLASGNALKPLPVQLIFLILVVLVSFICGLQFAVGTSISKGDGMSAAPAIYSADLLGSALGAILMSTLLIPLAGISGVCIGLVVLNLTIYAFLNFSKH